MIKRRCRSLLIPVLAVVCLTVLSSLPAAAQVQHNPVVNTPDHFDISPPLRDMAQQESPFYGFHEASPVLRPKLQQLMQAAQEGKAGVADGALQKTGGPLVSTIPGLNLLGVGTGFPGYTVPDAPPDVNLAVGDTQVVQWVNVSYAVFNKTTGAVIAGPIDGKAFWSGFGGDCQNRNDGDPIAQWDKIAHRWVMTQNTFSGSFKTCIAISTTDDATGSYFRYSFPQTAGFPDYPKWGLMPDAYYQSNNAFGSPFGVNACAYERAKLLVGDSTAKQICFDDTSGGTSFDDSMLPGDLDSASDLPPAGQPEVYVGSIDNGVTAQCPSGSCVFEYLFHVDFAVPANSTFTGTNGGMPIPGVSPFSLLCGGFAACVPQNGGELLDSLGDRLMYRLAYRNIGADHQTWQVSHSVVAGGSGGMRWYEFRAPEGSTALSTFQQGTFAPDSKYRWMGSIAMDNAQDTALGYSTSSASTFPAINYTGRVPGDPLGTMESEALIKAGTGSQVATSSRWGDYTSMQIDEANDCTFWYTAEYYMSTSSFNWSTQLASFAFANCGAQPNFQITATPPSQSVAGGGGTATYTATITPTSGFGGTVTLGLSGLPAGASASFVPPTITGSGSSTLTVTTTGATPSGTYVLQIDGKDGVLDPSTTVTLKVLAPPGMLTFTPTSLIFGKQVVNTTSAAKKITVKSTGTATVNFTSVVASGDFAISSNTCTGSLTVGSSCFTFVTFKPTALGTRTGNVTYTDDASGSPQMVPLSGTGIAPVTLKPLTANFKQAEDTTSAPKAFTLTNNQSVVLNVSSVAVTANYAETDNCQPTVAALASCTINVTFTPPGVGTFNGTLTVTDDASNSPQTASLTGTGVDQVTLNKTSLVFGNQKVGTTSAPKPVTLKNNLSTALTFSTATSGDFAESDTCGGSVAAGGTCTLNVTFTPTATGTRTGTLTVTSTDDEGPMSVSLTGTGTP